MKHVSQVSGSQVAKGADDDATCTEQSDPVEYTKNDDTIHSAHDTITLWITFYLKSNDIFLFFKQLQCMANPWIFTTIAILCVHYNKRKVLRSSCPSHPSRTPTSNNSHKPLFAKLIMSSDSDHFDPKAYVVAPRINYLINSSRVEVAQRWLWFFFKEIFFGIIFN